MDDMQWGEWLQVTDFDIRTAMLRRIQNIEVLSSPKITRSHLSNDECAGLAYLYLDSLSIDERKAVGQSEFSPYLPKNWPEFRNFLVTFPRGIELFVESSRFHNVRMFEPHPERMQKLQSWSSQFTDLLIKHPRSDEIRVCYLLGKAVLSRYTDFHANRPITDFYYFTARPSNFQSYLKPVSFRVTDFISDRRQT